jgi:2-oxoglutarate dehydrogenase E2 component (dihydrolipoamide succinyltransferase)
MPTAIKAPAMGESIAEAVVAKWLKKVGEPVRADEIVAELETDKVNLEVTAPVAGTLTSIATPAGSTVKVGQPMGEIAEGAVAAPTPVAAPTQPVAASGSKTAPSAVSAPAASAHAALTKSGPAVQKLASEQGFKPQGSGSGKDGRFTKADVLTLDTPTAGTPAKPILSNSSNALVERVPMTRIRKTIASRLKQAQNTAAMLTTYNEVDLHRIVEIRKNYKDVFEKKHGVKLGFMGFFTKAVVAALQEFPALNAEIEGDDILYKKHHDIGIAVSSDKGLVVPVLRGVTTMDISDIEAKIADFGKRAREGGLKPDELSGATFSITNGGVFGSMLSMPILNYPQVGILGMHAIKERPVVIEENGEKKIAIRPIMYVALTYDHRIVDGREAVSFLVKVKDLLEEPTRFVLGV